MDISTLLAAIGIMKKMPDNAASSAAAAEASAQRAELYGQLVDIVDDVLVIGEEDE